MEPKTYQVIQNEFNGGTLVKLQSGMYAILDSKGKMSDSEASIRSLMKAQETTNGSQDTSKAKRSTEDSTVQETGDRVVASDTVEAAKATFAPKPSAAKSTPRKSSKK